LDPHVASAELVSLLATTSCSLTQSDHRELQRSLHSVPSLTGIGCLKRLEGPLESGVSTLSKEMVRTFNIKM